MIDMDHTLIESVFPENPRYSKCKGILINDRHGKFKVNIRPGAPEMVQRIVDKGHRYILWSAGTFSYVHAVMKEFTKVSGVDPEQILTREDMVRVNPNPHFFKSNKIYGATKDNLVIVEDDPSLVDPDERDRIIQVSRWHYEDGNDREMDFVINLIDLYSLDNNEQCRYSVSRAEAAPQRRIRRVSVY